MDVGSKDQESASSSRQDGKKPSSEKGIGTEEARTNMHSVGDRGESLDSIEYVGEDYDDYDDFDLTKSIGGGGGGGTKRAQKKEKGSAANIYSSKHTRMREARKGQGK
jgi:hypothetical protein